MTKTMHLALMERNVAQRRLGAVMLEVKAHKEAKWASSGSLDEADQRLYARCREIVRALPTIAPPEIDSKDPYGVRPSVLA